MNRGPRALVVSVVAVASLGLATAAVPAGQFHGRPVGQFHGRPVGHRPVVGRPPFASHPFGHQHHFVPRPFVRPFVPLGVIAAPIVYAPSPLLYEPSAAYAPSASYAVPAGYGPPMSGTISVAPSPPPMPSVIPYPTGRYELRGDGVAVPYTWVWIPNPPPPPPPTEPMEPAADGDSSPVRLSRLYRWTDAEGVAHWTDRWNAVPEQYRTQATEPLSR